ncbi:hypothetical protein CSUI_002416, partial [Cystoisospora suis]
KGRKESFLLSILIYLFSFLLTLPLDSFS